LDSLRHEARKTGVDLRLRTPENFVLVQADQLLLRECLTNLILNGIQAAPRHGYVTVTCGTRGDGHFIRVADNGPGVSDAHRKRLFEPHFTTKPNGTGMGLFMSYGIVREHQGRLLYEGSKRGAVFTMVLPPAVAAEARRERLSQPV
jgi:signal transduction histidine kinase